MHVKSEESSSDESISIRYKIEKKSSAEVKTNNKVYTNEDSPMKQNDLSPREETGKDKLLRWINKQMKIEMTDGRVLIGVFLCTDRDGNVILGSCSEYLTEACGIFDEPRMLGLVMVPGRHIVSIHHAPDHVETGEIA